MRHFVFLTVFVFVFWNGHAKPLLTNEAIVKVKKDLLEKNLAASDAIDKVFDFYQNNRKSVGGLKDASCIENKSYKIRKQDPKQKKEDLFNGILNESCVCFVDFTKPKSVNRGTCVFLNASGIDKIETFPVAHGSGSVEKDGKPTTFTNKLTPTGTTLSGLHLTAAATAVFGGKEKSVGPYRSTGLSLYGLESTNWTASAVGKVTHGAPYVKENPISVGHSLGCPAMPIERAKSILPLCQGQAAWLNYTLEDQQKKSLFRSCKPASASNISSDSVKSEPPAGLLKNGAVGAVLLLDSNSANTFKVKIVFPNSQVVGTNSPEKQENKKYTELRYAVKIASDIAIYDQEGLLGTIPVPKISEGVFWCENDGGAQYRPELIFEVERNKLKRSLVKRDKLTGFAAFALVDSTFKLGPLTYKAPSAQKILDKQVAKIGPSKSANIQFLLWDEVGAVSYGPYAGLALGESYFALTCDGP